MRLVTRESIKLTVGRQGGHEKTYRVHVLLGFTIGHSRGTLLGRTAKVPSCLSDLAVDGKK
jgi:hypothetical protein